MLNETETQMIEAELNQLQARGGRTGWKQVSKIVKLTGARRDDVIDHARKTGLTCEPHGRYGYTIW